MKKLNAVIFQLIRQLLFSHLNLFTLIGLKTSMEDWNEEYIEDQNEKSTLLFILQDYKRPNK